MKLRAIKEASTLSRYPLSQEVFRRAQKRGYYKNIKQEDIGRFAAWLDVEVNGLDHKDLKRIIWDGIKGLKDDPAGVEKVFAEFVNVYIEDVEGFNNPRLTDDARDEGLDELADEFHTFMSGKRHR